MTRGDVTTKLVNAVHRAAVELAGFALEAGDAALATWATEKGFVVWHEVEDLAELYLSRRRLVRPLGLSPGLGGGQAALRLRQRAGTWSARRALPVPQEQRCWRAKTKHGTTTF